MKTNTQPTAIEIISIPYGRPYLEPLLNHLFFAHVTQDYCYIKDRTLKNKETLSNGYDVAIPIHCCQIKD